MTSKPKPSFEEQLYRLHQVSDWRGVFALCREWSLIFFYFFLVIQYPHPLVWFVCFILLGRQSYALFVLLHEASHGHLLRSRKWNDFVGEWLCAAPITFFLGAFKTQHLIHHKEPLVKTDPEYMMTGGFPISRASLRRKLLRDLFGLTNYRGNLLLNFQRARMEGFRAYIPTVTVLLIMWIGFCLLGHPLYVLFFWMLPGATVAVVFVRIGILSQHAGLKPNPDQSQVARTVTSPLSYFFLPLNLNYHGEHHLYPRVPFYHLPRLHRYLNECQMLTSRIVYRSYAQIIKEITY